MRVGVYPGGRACTLAPMYTRNAHSTQGRLRACLQSRLHTPAHIGTAPLPYYCTLMSMKVHTHCTHAHRQTTGCLHALLGQGGALPTLLAASMLAPASSSARTTSTWPFLAAMYSGVHPSCAIKARKGDNSQGINDLADGGIYGHMGGGSSGWGKHPRHRRCRTRLHPRTQHHCCRLQSVSQCHARGKLECLTYAAQTLLPTVTGQQQRAPPPLPHAPSCKA